MKTRPTPLTFNIKNYMTVFTLIKKRYNPAINDEAYQDLTACIDSGNERQLNINFKAFSRDELANILSFDHTEVDVTITIEKSKTPSSTWTPDIFEDVNK